MNRNALLTLLQDVQSGRRSPEAAAEALRHFPYEDMGFARLDNHRALRQGYPEVIFCQGKTVDQVAAIAGRILARHGTFLATRATPEMYEAVKADVPQARYYPLSRAIVVRPPGANRRVGRILILSAGTSDIPVAEEAAVTAEVFGSRVETRYDVGVAGLHRVLDQRAALDAARVIIVAAGMDGVLPSVVGGLAAKPVIAVPTSVGYGASFQGLAALLTMLNSCAAGIAVVNIDNGFGAGVLAHRINTAHSGAKPSLTRSSDHRAPSAGRARS
jgi:pyridinium-3,5-biscarboxylic acid mononucleotide synthase